MATDGNALRITIEAQELERQRICLEVHDGFAQRLSRTFHQLQVLDGMSEAELLENRARIPQATAEIRGALQEARQLIQRLRPASLSTVGLAKTLDGEVSALERDGVQVHFRPRIDRCIPESVELAVFRVIHEALNNIASHSRATHAWVDLASNDDEVRAVVGDDGVGFDLDEVLDLEVRGNGRYGLVSMRTRIEMLGGDWSIDSAPGCGTLITFSISLPADGPQHPAEQGACSSTAAA